jgi:hypothetical protein
MSGHAAPAAPAAAASAVQTDYVRDLAAQIYVGMVPSVMLKAPAAGQPKPNPVDLAKYCYKLAEAFQSIEIEAGKEAVARTAKYEVKDGDMSSWLK